MTLTPHSRKEEMLREAHNAWTKEYIRIMKRPPRIQANADWWLSRIDKIRKEAYDEGYEKGKLQGITPTGL